MTVTFVKIEDEFNRLFSLLSLRESMRNTRLMKQMQRIRLRLLAMKEELKRKQSPETEEVKS